MTRPVEKVDVVWDGTRVYRVPSPGEIEAILLMSEGLGTPEASTRLGLRAKDGAKRRATEAQTKLHALSPAGALYQMYRLQLVPMPVDVCRLPVLNEEQLNVLDVLTHLGLPYDQAHVGLGIGRTTMARRMSEIYEALGAVNRVQALCKAVESGDVVIVKPHQLWRGVV